MTYIVRQIDLIFQLQNGRSNFEGTNSNSIKLTGARCLVVIGTVINNTAVVGGATAAATIYGMRLDQMNQLTVAGTQYKFQNNRITINAGDAGAQKATVFSGFINEAHPDFTQSPDAALVVTGFTNSDINMKPVSPLSFQGSVSASDAFQKMASTAGLRYENNGVNAQFSSGYFPGTVGQQIAAAAKWANCYAWIDGPNNTLVTVARNTNRSGDAVEISPRTGMIGYPQYQATQVVVRSIFDPSVKYYGLINVISDLTPANGQSRVVGLEYSLSSQIPDGPWEMKITAQPITQGQG